MLHSTLTGLKPVFKKDYEIRLHHTHSCLSNLHRWCDKLPQRTHGVVSTVPNVMTCVRKSWRKCKWPRRVCEQLGLDNLDRGPSAGLSEPGIREGHALMYAHSLEPFQGQLAHLSLVKDCNSEGFGVYFSVP